MTEHKALYVASDVIEADDLLMERLAYVLNQAADGVIFELWPELPVGLVSFVRTRLVMAMARGIVPVIAVVDDELVRRGGAPSCLRSRWLFCFR